MEVKNGLLFVNGKQVTFVPTPNKNQNKTIVPAYLVIHYTADNNPASTISWFKNPKASASAHLLIDREGNITQFGKFTERLWHAGASMWKGLTDLNSHSIGIELTNLGKVNKSTPNAIEINGKWWHKYTDKQISVLKEVTDTLVAAYGLKDVIGHEQIAPGRKIDPGAAFPWVKIKPLQRHLETTSGLNLRKGAGTDSEVLLVIPEGAIVEEHSRNGGWSSVTYSGVSGYVSNKYLK